MAEQPSAQPVGIRDIESLLKKDQRKTDRMVKKKLTIFYEQIFHRLSVRSPLQSKFPAGEAEIPARRKEPPAEKEEKARLFSRLLAQQTATAAKEKKKKKKGRKKKGGTVGKTTERRGDAGVGPAAGANGSEARALSRPAPATQTSSTPATQETWSQVVVR